jgi:hypothetical protein
MAIVKTQDLIGVPLDYMMVKYMALGEDWRQTYYGSPIVCGEDIFLNSDNRHKFNPSRMWDLGGPLIEQVASNAVFDVKSKETMVWVIAGHDGKTVVGQGFGPNLLVAGCRAIVSTFFGQEVEIPDFMLKPEKSMIEKLMDAQNGKSKNL